MVSIKKICTDFLDKEEAQQFAKWAFGPEYRTMAPIDLPFEWNKIHPTLKQFDASGDAIRDLEEMICIWHEQKEWVCE